MQHAHRALAKRNCAVNLQGMPRRGRRAPTKDSTYMTAMASADFVNFEDDTYKYQGQAMLFTSLPMADAFSCYIPFPPVRLPPTIASSLRGCGERVVLLVGLAVRLWSFLGIGWKWAFNLYCLFLYAILLLPGFLKMIYYYFSSPSVKRDVLYGHKARQTLDLYIPCATTFKGPRPVVIFVTGGAWTIGYKAWGALLARRLSDQGVLVCSLDYRNFPQGTALDMVEDVNTGIAWTLRNIHKYGGDPHKIYLCGQSAGGQLGALALLRQAQAAATGQWVLGASPCWHPRDIQGFIGVSGAYDIEGLATHLHKRGLYKNLFDSIMSVDGRPAYTLLSPLHVAQHTLQQCATVSISPFMPRVLLLHGTADKSVPHPATLRLHNSLKELGVDCSVQLFEGKTHTQPLIEDPMSGQQDVLMDSILSLVTGKDEFHPQQAMCPKLLCWMASWVCPF